MGRLTRRTLLTGIGATAAIGGLGSGFVRPAAAAPTAPTIRPRADWAGGMTATGTLQTEADGDVRFLIVHHSESPNSERPGTVPGRLRSFFNYHTGTKKWPDVAYNFFVDPFGEIWEGRTGSLARPVRGDATGGSQGYAQLCCFVGDHNRSAPTPAAMDSMAALLAWLAGRYRIDLDAGKSITFTSRGSNRWPRGTEVTTDPIVGHRDMSQTACPGDALYPLVRSQLLPEAQRLSRTGDHQKPAPAPTVDGPTQPVETQEPSTPSEPPAASTPATESAAPEGPLAALGGMAVPLGAGVAVLGGAVIAGGIVLAQKDR